MMMMLARGARRSSRVLRHFYRIDGGGCEAVGALLLQRARATRRRVADQIFWLLGGVCWGDQVSLHDVSTSIHSQRTQK